MMNWDYLIGVLDVVASIGTIVCISLVAKYYKVWLLYSSITILFIVVQVYNRIPGASAMAAALFFIGLRNYWIERKKHRG